MLMSQPASFPNYSNRAVVDVSSADPDIVLVSPDTLDATVQVQLVLQQIGGTELIQIERHDTVNGQNIVYQPIADINEFASNNNSTNILGFASNLQGYKNNFGINLDNYIEILPQNSGPNYSETNISLQTNVIAELLNIDQSTVIEISTSPVKKYSLFEKKNYVDGGNASVNFDGIIDGGNSLGYNVDNTTDGGNS